MLLFVFHLQQIMRPHQSHTNPQPTRWSQGMWVSAWICGKRGTGSPKVNFRNMSLNKEAGR